MARIKVKGRVFGHPIYQDDDLESRWEDNDELVPRTSEGHAYADAKHPCPGCGEGPSPEGHDPCIANLEGVDFACCGHGGHDNPYVAFDEDEFGNRRVIRDEEALEYFRLLDNNKD